MVRTNQGREKKKKQRPSHQAVFFLGEMELGERAELRSRGPGVKEVNISAGGREAVTSVKRRVLMNVLYVPSVFWDSRMICC